jgi:hypothetical protein
MPTSFKEVISAIPGLTHYYPLTDAYGPNDAAKGLNGVNHGATFDDSGAIFDGKSYVQLPDHDDFSAATTGFLTIVAFLTITNWKGAGASEYIHWLGKGKPGGHEYTFRHYVDGGTGEAATRQGRISFYHFNPEGGLGAGSYFQDAEDKTERVVVGTVDKTNIAIWRDGVQRDTDALSGYSIKPQNTSTQVCLGSRGDSTGFLVGRLRNIVFFNRKLTTAEIKAIYDARSLPVDSTMPPPPVTPLPSVTGKVTIGAASHDLDGINKARGVDELIQYTPSYGPRTQTNPYGAEAAVGPDHKVLAVQASTGNGPIPTGGYVLSGHGESASWLVANAKVGATVQIGDEPVPPPVEPPPNPGAAYIATGLDDVVGKHNALVNKLADKGLLS